MITPVSNNMLSSTNGLKPVEVPHFKGACAMQHNGEDVLIRKAAAKTNLDIAKDGAKNGVHIIADTTKKTGRFLYHLVNSIYEDSKAVIKNSAIKNDIMDTII